jgi:pimeloyl-ACP methyl ester carboxylesterase
VVAVLALALTTAAMILVGCTSTVPGKGVRLGAPVAGAPVPAPLTFVDCTQRILSLGVKVPKALTGTVRFGCGELQVPLDYAHPDGPKTTLAMIRIHTTQNTTRPLQSLLVNPGGPGGSGVQFGLGVYAELPVAVARAYDIIAFDPRGVGESSPVHCLTDRQKDAYFASSPDLTTAAGVAEVRRQSQQFATDCARRIGKSLPDYDTVATARDMDQIRQAVGDDRMNYLGFSYGTELGWTYAHLFPKQVHTFVLDGAVDPSLRNTTEALAQVRGFEKAFDQFAVWCRRAPDCRVLGNPRAATTAIFDRARRSPLRTQSAPRPLTESLASTGVIEALYSKSEWPQLASALVAARGGDGSGLLTLADRYNQRTADGSYSNLTDANAVITCNDEPRHPPPSTARVLATARAWGRKFPLFGADAAAQLFGCTGWQPDRTPVPSPAAATPTTVLVVGNLHDPATPYTGAVHLAQQLGHAELLTWDGEGHTSYLSGSACIDGYVTSYLIRGTLPPEHKVCPAK